MLHALQFSQIHHPTHESMGYSWFCWFKSCHPKNLDTSYAAAVNPTIIEHYYKLLEATLLEYRFIPSEIYSFNESGFPFGGDRIHEHVYGRESGIQHKQGEGNKENVSTMITICAGGTYTTPTAIFKGKNYNSAWAEADSTLHLQVRHWQSNSFSISDKGWTDGEIGLAWLKNFNNQTQIKNEGWPHLLLLDEHNLHYTMGFIEYEICHSLSHHLSESWSDITTLSFTPMISANLQADFADVSCMPGSPYLGLDLKDFINESYKWKTLVVVYNEHCLRVLCWSCNASILFWTADYFWCNFAFIPDHVILLFFPNNCTGRNPHAFLFLSSLTWRLRSVSPILLYFFSFTYLHVPSPKH